MVEIDAKPDQRSRLEHCLQSFTLSRYELKEMERPKRKVRGICWSFTFLATLLWRIDVDKLWLAGASGDGFTHGVKQLALHECCGELILFKLSACIFQRFLRNVSQMWCEV